MLARVNLISDRGGIEQRCIVVAGGLWLLNDSIAVQLGKVLCAVQFAVSGFTELYLSLQKTSIEFYIVAAKVQSTIDSGRCGWQEE